MLAGIELKAMLKAEAELLATPREDWNMALQLAGGSLNNKFQVLTTQFVLEGRASKEEAVLAMGLSLIHLANLAQHLGFTAASQCYLIESRQMMLIAEGKAGGPVNCRAGVFSADMRADAIQRGHGPRARKLGELVNTWATKAVMQGLQSAKAGVADPSRR